MSTIINPKQDQNQQFLSQKYPQTISKIRTNSHLQLPNNNSISPPNRNHQLTIQSNSSLSFQGNYKEISSRKQPKCVWLLPKLLHVLRKQLQKHSIQQINQLTSK